MEPRTEKACTRCSVVKAMSEFHRLKPARDGRASWCKTCAAELSNRAVRDMRVRVLVALGGVGGVCTGPGLDGAGCGISDLRVLTVDHRGGGGHAHRKRAGTPYSYYKRMLDELGDYQALCWNCQHLKRIERREHRVALIDR